jgi:opacity protein-like surface antigen
MAHNGQCLRGLLLSLCAALTLVALPTLAAAQNPNPQPSGSFQAPSNPDFMLGRPRASIGLRGQWLFASAGSDIYDFMTEQLTVERSSFNAPGFGAEFGVNVTPRLDVLAGFDLAKSSTPSHYREKSEQVGNAFLPIQQTTELQTTSMFVNAKFALIPRGRTISRFAWIPSTIVPYVGVGGGVTKYNFRQQGDFVDFSNDNIFSDTFRSQGWAPTMHVLGGTDIQVFKRIFLSVEGRYSWAHGKLDSDFIDFEPMDLGGFRFGAGFHIAF